MNQDSGRSFDGSTECGNPFSLCHENVVDQIQIKFEDESDGFDDPAVHNDNTDYITDFSDENKECGKSFTNNDYNAMIDQTKIKVEDESDGFDHHFHLLL